MATSTGRLKGAGLTVTGNATSAACESFCCAGIECGDVRGSSLDVSGNNGIGILARFTKLRDSTIFENRRLGAIRGLVIAEKPKLRNVACDSSSGWGGLSAVTWGVCALDNN